MLAGDDRRKLIWCAFARLFRSRTELEAEILVLRHQQNVLCRKSPGRLAFSSIDRLVFARRTRPRSSRMRSIRLVGETAWAVARYGPSAAFHVGRTGSKTQSSCPFVASRAMTRSNGVQKTSLPAAGIGVTSKELRVKAAPCRAASPE